jgi:hypothetical protein
MVLKIKINEVYRFILINCRINNDYLSLDPDGYILFNFSLNLDGKMGEGIYFSNEGVINWDECVYYEDDHILRLRHLVKSDMEKVAKGLILIFEGCGASVFAIFHVRLVTNLLNEKLDHEYYYLDKNSNNYHMVVGKYPIDLLTPVF